MGASASWTFTEPKGKLGFDLTSNGCVGLRLNLLEKSIPPPHFFFLGDPQASKGEGRKPYYVSEETLGNTKVNNKTEIENVN